MPIIIDIGVAPANEDCAQLGITPRLWRGKPARGACLPRGDHRRSWGAALWLPSGAEKQPPRFRNLLLTDADRHGRGPGRRGTCLCSSRRKRS